MEGVSKLDDWSPYILCSLLHVCKWNGESECIALCDVGCQEATFGLPFRPQPVHVCVMDVEEGVARGRKLIC